jgi:hypothetical protein
LNDIRLEFKRCRAWALYPYVYGVPVSWWLLPTFMKHIKGKDFFIDGWIFSIPYAESYLREYNNWIKYYIPPSGVKLKSVLDIGVGCGETAKLYFDCGARLVEGIEPSSSCQPYLKYNESHHNLHCYNRKFNPKTDVELMNTFDLVKMDIEGYEQELIPYLDKLDVDFILECHTVYLRDVFYDNGFEDSDSTYENPLGWDSRILHRWKKK